MPIVHDLPPDEKWSRPRSVREAIWQIEQTLVCNEWKEAEQIVFLADLNLDKKWEKLGQAELAEILKEWRKFDNVKLKRILQSFEHYRMILYQ